MKVRIKFTKNGPLKFVGHLDIMRYFQKAFRRAGVDIAYSKGFSPHQQLSFAAPLGIGLTSDGEYMDAEFLSVESSASMIERLNAVMSDGIEILEFHELPDDAKNAMSSVAGADYRVSFREGYDQAEAFYSNIAGFLAQAELRIVKKTKKSEQEVDIRPMIYEMRVEDAAIFMKLCTGSAANLKPETVLEAFTSYLGISFDKMAFQVHRLETYYQEEEGNSQSLRPLGQVGHPILT